MLDLERLRVPECLSKVPQDVLEEYVVARVKQFARSFTLEVNPTITDDTFEAAFARTLYSLGNEAGTSSSELTLTFQHNCKFLGCSDKDCKLCKNNPNKTCQAQDNFDNCYADNQVLRTKCDADINIAVCSKESGELQQVSGIEIQLSLVDGESYQPASQSGAPLRFTQLLQSDEGIPLLSCSSKGKITKQGYVLLNLQNGKGKLPEVCVTDKNDTFHKDGNSFSTFRLMAQAVCRDKAGNPIVIPSIGFAVSAKFVVKTQRALNDYRKSEYPHYKDELTKLRYIGSITAQRLKDVKAHVMPNVPFTSIETVEDFKALMAYADTNRQCENKLLDLLNMKGRHKHKWDYLRTVMAERMVEDDSCFRCWFSDESQSQGLLYACKQAQVTLDKPLGVFQRISQGGSYRLQASLISDNNQQEAVKPLKDSASEAWNQEGHSGWAVVTEPLEWIGGQPQVIPVSFSPGLSGPLSHSGTLSPQTSASEQYLAAMTNVPSMAAGVGGPQGYQYNSAQVMLPGSHYPITVDMDRRSPHVSPHMSPHAGAMSDSFLQLMPEDYPHHHRNGSVDLDHRFMDSNIYSAGDGSSMYSRQTTAGHTITSGSAQSFGSDGYSNGVRMDSGGNLGKRPSPQVLASGHAASMPPPAAAAARAGLSRSIPNMENPLHNMQRRHSFDDAASATYLANHGAKIADLNQSLNIKRGRNADPVQPSAGEGLFGDTAAQSSVSRARQVLYHQESRGRHMPRSRPHMDDTDKGRLDQQSVLERALDKAGGGHPWLTPDSYLFQGGYSSEAGNPATPSLNASWQALGQPQGHDFDFEKEEIRRQMKELNDNILSGGGQAEGDEQGGLTDKFKSRLNIGDGEDAPNPGSRVLRRSESDSFKYMIEPIASPGTLEGVEFMLNDN